MQRSDTLKLGSSIGSSGNLDSPVPPTIRFQGIPMLSSHLETGDTLCMLETHRYSLFQGEQAVTAEGTLRGSFWLKEHLKTKP